jgi:hypothetical protein
LHTKYRKIPSSSNFMLFMHIFYHTLCWKAFQYCLSLLLYLN